MRRLRFGAAKLRREFDGGMVLMLRLSPESVAPARGLIDEMEGREYVAEVKRYRERRSLDANAYCWVLLDALGARLGIDKTELYRAHIREIGGNCEIVCVKEASAEKLRSAWESHGLGWVTDQMESKLKGCVNVVLYYGSSTYDTAQMSRLIDNIVQDCKAQGIDTRTPEEIARLKEEWAR